MVEKVNDENYDHKLYKHTKEIKDADAVAYSFVSKDKGVFFPYKQPTLKSHELRANVLYAGLCLSDSLTVRGGWGHNIHFPIAPGHEIIGEVIEVGDDVKDFKKGDKVAFGTMRRCCGECKYCKTDREPLCNTKIRSEENELFTYGYQWGGYSTQIQQPADFFFKVDDKLKLDKAAPLLCAGVTVYTPISRYAKPGMKTAVIGIGGLGHLAIQFLHKLGYDVDAITTTLDKEKSIKELGANNVISSKDPESVKKAARSYDFIINTSPNCDNFEEMLSLTANGGYFCQVGSPGVDQKAKFHPSSIILTEINIVGSLVGSRSMVKEMLKICTEKDIYPIVEMFQFEEFDKAVDKLENGKPIFRCVVNCSDYAKKNGLYK